MAETIPSDIPDEPPVIDEDEAASGIPTLLLAFVTLALYILFLKPTAAETENNNNNNARQTRERQRQRGGNRRQVQPQQQQPATPQQQQQARRRLQMSENAVEVLETCKSIPPHVVTKPSSRSSSNNNNNKTIGGFEMLSESGLVAFSHTRAAAESAQTSSTASSRPLTTPQKSGSNAPGAVTMDRAASTPESSNSKPSAVSGTPSLLQRKERAKILSRLFAATNVDHATKGIPAPPSKGSTFVVGVSQEKHLSDSDQRASLLCVIKGLATHYTVLLVVSPPQATGSDSSRYETTQTLHTAALKLLRGDDELSESLLPSHRVLLAGSATGRVALVRQLSTNIGLTVDFDAGVREELERFGYEVSIVTDWGSILPPAK